VPETIRQRAETLLRYYPEVADMATIAHNNCTTGSGTRWQESLKPVPTPFTPAFAFNAFESKLNYKRQQK
jgi:hypothetical protein